MTLHRFVADWLRNAVSIAIPIVTSIGTLVLYRTVVELSYHL